MSDWVVNGAIIRFELKGNCQWSGWDGRLALSCPDRGLASDTKPVALAEDVENLAQLLAGKLYTATGFEDIRGIVSLPQVRVAIDTLDSNVTCGDRAIVVKSTEGSFTVACVPAFRAGSPPIPDPMPVKRGRWFVERPGQSLAASL
jgi:hypothetical protein